MPLDIEAIQRLRPHNRLHYFASIDSTMTEAARLAAQNAPHGTVVVSDEQTAGIGRLGRSWQSPVETGIYSTILLRLPVSPQNIPIASLLLGLGTADAITGSTDLICDLRWPNDVLIQERKAAGILAQFVDGCILAGIGINVNQSSFPEGLRTPATSLFIESGRTQSRETILVQLLVALDHYCSILVEHGAAGILRAFTAASSYVIHRRVLIEENSMEGVTAGLDENGFLLVRLDNGRIQRITSGGVRPAAGGANR